MRKNQRKPCLSVFLHLLGEDVPDKQQNRNKTKNLFQSSSFVLGGGFCLFLFLVLLYFFLSLLPFFLYLSSFCFKEKDTESNITPKNKRGKATLKKTTNKENTKTMNNEEQQQTKKSTTPTNKYQKEMLDHKVNPPPQKKGTSRS